MNHSEEMQRFNVPATTPQYDAFDIVSFLKLLWRNKLLIALVMFLSLAAGVYYSYWIAAPKFSSKATLVLETETGQVVDLQSVVTGTSTDSASINTQIGVILSRGLLLKVVQELDLQNDPEFNTALDQSDNISIGRLIGKFKAVLAGVEYEPHVLSENQILDLVVETLGASVRVANVSQSYLFDITATSRDPRKASLIANTIAEMYIADQVDVKFSRTEQAITWLTNRSAELKIQLEKSEDAVQTFLAANQVIQPEESSALLRQLDGLRERSIALSVESAAVEAKGADARSMLANGDIAGIAALLSQPEATRLSAALTRDVGAARIAAEAAIRAFDLEKARLDAQYKTVVDSITSLESKYEALSTSQLTYEQLLREAEASRQIYEYFLARLKETAVQQGIHQADSRILSAAPVPYTPIEPRKPLILIGACAFGLFLALMIVIVMESISSGIKTSDQLEEISTLPNLGLVPIVPDTKRKTILQYLRDNPTSPVSESLRNLRTSLLMSNATQAPKLIMVTSSLPREGKTTISIVLSSYLASLGRKVLLVEGDVRRMVMKEYFDPKAAKGTILSVASREKSLSESVVKIDDLGIDLLFGARTTINAADFFNSERFHEMLLEMAADYDHVVVDTPPVLSVPDSRIIGGYFDAILYVVRWNIATSHQVRSGLQSLASVGAKVTGTVLNQIDISHLKRSGYGQGYYGYDSEYGSSNE